MDEVLKKNPHDATTDMASSLLLETYPEWPDGLGDPAVQVLDSTSARCSAQGRKAIVAAFRRSHNSTATTTVPHKRFRTMRVEEACVSQATVRRCSFQIQCRRGVATKKCHSCVKFDEHKLGYFCDACFAARHPPYRLEHSWIPIQDDVNPEDEWIAHAARDPAVSPKAPPPQSISARTLRPPSTPAPPPLSTRLATHARRLSTPSGRPSSWPQEAVATPPPRELDFRATYATMASIQNTLHELLAQVHADLERPPAAQKARLSRDVFASFQDPATGATYYYNTRTKTTQWTKPKALGDEALVVAASATPKKAPRVAVEFATRAEQEHAAALCIQGMLRARAARDHMRRLISSVYEKIWDDTTGRFYYHNTQTKQVSWERPRWVNDADLGTPRTRQQRQQQQQRDAKALLHTEMTPEQAVTMVQRAYRRKRGFETLLTLCRTVYERIYDPSRDAYYYHNTRTKQTTWEKPAVLRNTQADVFTPRTRQKQQQLKTLAHLGDKRRPRVWMQDSAAVCLQGLFRKRQAQKALCARLVQVYRKALDPDSGLFYYVNVETQAVSWEPPALAVMSNVALEDSFHSFWDDAICNVLNVVLSGIGTSDRNSSQSSPTGSDRPGHLFVVNSVCAFCGEEKAPNARIETPRRELCEKLIWTCGNVPCLFGYVAVGFEADLYVIVRNSESGQVDAIVLGEFDLKNLGGRFWLLLAIFNISRLLRSIASLCPASGRDECKSLIRSNGVQVELEPTRVPSSVEDLFHAIRDVLLALVELHESSWMHRDTRWTNVIKRRDGSDSWSLIDCVDAAPSPQYKPSGRHLSQEEHTLEIHNGDHHTTAVDVWCPGSRECPRPRGRARPTRPISCATMVVHVVLRRDRALAALVLHAAAVVDLQHLASSDCCCGWKMKRVLGSLLVAVCANGVHGGAAPVFGSLGGVLEPGAGGCGLDEIQLASDGTIERQSVELGERVTPNRTLNGTVTDGEYHFYHLCVVRHDHEHQINVNLAILNSSPEGDANLYASSEEKHPRMGHSAWIAQQPGSDFLKLYTYLDGFPRQRNNEVTGGKTQMIPLHIGVLGVSEEAPARYELTVSVLDLPITQDIQAREVFYTQQHERDRRVQRQTTTELLRPAQRRLRGGQHTSAKNSYKVLMTKCTCLLTCCIFGVLRSVVISAGDLKTRRQARKRQDIGHERPEKRKCDVHDRVALASPAHTLEPLGLGPLPRQGTKTSENNE
ncbi:Crinkler, partial [Globisporangium splendens]